MVNRVVQLNRKRYRKSELNKHKKKASKAPGFWASEIKPYWMSNIPGDDTRDEVCDLRENANKLIRELRKRGYDTEADDVNEIIDEYDSDGDMEETFAIYDTIRNYLSNSGLRNKRTSST